MIKSLPAVIFSVVAAAANAAPADKGTVPIANAISEASATKATVAPDGVVRIEWPRTDVPVKIDGVVMPAPAGLGTWAAFKSAEVGTLVMGDTVLFQDEVDAAMDAAFAGGLDVTGLHNHFFYDEPKVYFMHLHGHGDARQLAASVKAVWDAVKRVRAANPAPAAGFGGTRPESGSIEPAEVERITGLKSKAPSGSLVKVSVGHETSMHGVMVSESMGVNSWAAFSGSERAASMDGDFVMAADEVRPVLTTLRGKGVHIVALHNHMMGETPACFFTHFWANGTVEQLAAAFKSALDAQRAVHAKQ